MKGNKYVSFPVPRSPFPVPRSPFPVPRKSCLLGFVTALTLSTSIACANDFVDISVEIDGWTMLPIADNGATTHIIATRNDDEAITTDIDVVLYEKTATGWSGEAYSPNVTKEDAMIDIANEFGLPDPVAGDWLIDLDEIDVLNYLVPRVPFGKGFFVDDPLYFIAQQMADSEPLAEGAELAGLPAASGAVNTGAISGGSNVGDPQPVDCGCEACIQTGVETISNLLLSDPAMLSEDLLAFAALVPGFDCPCYIRLTRPTASTAWSPWVCGGWTTSLNASTGICTSTTISSRSRSRTMTTTCWSCISGTTTLTWTQFKNQSGSVSVRSGVNANGTCTPPVSCPAPPNPSGSWFWTPPTGPGCPRP